jgi:hypothetical protein
LLIRVSFANPPYACSIVGLFATMYMPGVCRACPFLSANRNGGGRTEIRRELSEFCRISADICRGPAGYLPELCRKTVGNFTEHRTKTRRKMFVRISENGFRR